MSATYMPHHEALSLLAGGISRVRAAQNAGRLTGTQATGLITDLHDTYDLISRVRGEAAERDMWAAMAANQHAVPNYLEAASGFGGRMPAPAAAPGTHGGAA